MEEEEWRSVEAVYVLDEVRRVEAEWRSIGAVGVLQSVEV